MAVFPAGNGDSPSYRYLCGLLLIYSILFVFYSFTRPLVCLTTNKSNCFTQLPSRLTPTPTATVPLGGKVTDPCQGTRQGGIRKYCAAAGKV